MIDAGEASAMTSKAYDAIAEEKFEEFKEKAEKYIAKAISLGRWYCSIPCDLRARSLACLWLKGYGYQAKFDSGSVFVDWSEY